VARFAATRNKIALVAAAVAVGAATIPLGPAVARAIQDVFITNDAAHPVPTAVTNDGAHPVPVAIGGTPTVGISPDANTVVVRDPETAREPVRIILRDPPNNSYTVPSGKRLVVELVGTTATIGIPEPVWVVNLVDNGSGHSSTIIDFLGEAVPGCDAPCYVLNQQTHFYVDEGDQVVRVAGGEGTAFVNLRLGTSSTFPKIPSEPSPTRTTTTETATGHYLHRAAGTDL
jgi:hypothetical protein